LDGRLRTGIAAASELVSSGAFPVTNRAGNRTTWRQKVGASDTRPQIPPAGEHRAAPTHQAALLEELHLGVVNGDW